MKNIFLTILVVLAFATVAFADNVEWSATLLSQSTGVSNGAANKVVNYPVKQIIIGNVSGTSFVNYSGVVTIKGSQSSTGPWFVLKDVGGNAVTKTHDLTGTGAVFNIKDLTPWVRAEFSRTSAATKNVVTVIMNYAQERTAQ